MDDHRPPLQPDELDELLSAELDGELAAAALDLGLSTDDAAARLRSTPGTAERRAALAAARDRLSEPPEIEELLAARLRAKAVRAAEEENATRDGDRRNRRRRLLLAAGGLAAVIAAVVGVAGGLSGSRSETNTTGAKRAAGAPTPDKAATAEGSTPVPSSDLGPFLNVHDLALAAVSHAAPSRSALDATGASGYNAHNQDEFGAPAAIGSSTKSVDRATSAAAACAAPPQLLLGGTPVLRATATLSGKPVVVLVFAGAREHTVVVEDTNCTLLNVQMLS
ncbi:MAG: hypothetical protein M3Q30_16680 [Actinomycetota bacterium]|nr:hypothetical protein [Actinomycetota bacterium]